MRAPRPTSARPGSISKVLRGTLYPEPLLAKIAPAVQAARHGLALPQRRAPFRIAVALIKRLAEGQYPPGSWMPIEVDLLYEFKISRTVLREAFIVLECLGLVEAHGGVGWKVTGRAYAPMARFPPALDAVALLEAGAFFEAEAVALTAMIGPRSLPKPIGLPPRATLGDCRTFHIELAQATGNLAIALSITNLWQVTSHRPEICTVLSAALAKLGGQVDAKQGKVIDAILARDPEAARAAMKALFETYLISVLDIEEKAQLQRACDEHLERRRVWTSRLGPGEHRTLQSRCKRLQGGASVP